MVGKSARTKKSGDKERRKLQAVLNYELGKTEATIAFKRKLRSLGRPAEIRRIALRYSAFPPLEGESRQEYDSRLQEEADKLGISIDDLVRPYIGVDVTYWELPGTTLVYIDEPMIARFNTEGLLKKLPLDVATIEELTEAVEGLRGLRSAK